MNSDSHILPDSPAPDAVSSANATTPPPVATVATSSPPRIHVLYAEDDPDDSLIVKVRIRRLRLPIALKIVPNGSLAIEYLLRRGAYRDRDPLADPRIVITDLRMRGINSDDAMQLIHFIRNHRPLKCVPIIVHSGVDYQRDIAAALEAGATVYVKKSAECIELLDHLQRLTQFIAASDASFDPALGKVKRRTSTDS